MTDFPLPRSMLPKLTEHRNSHKTIKRAMKRLLKHTVSEFEKLTYARNGVVDMTQWRALSKAQASQNGQHDDQVAVYSERECGVTSTDLAYKLQANGSMLAALTPSAVLVSGHALGKVENIMYALAGTHTQQGLALLTHVMYDDVADCGILHTLESDKGDEEASCQFLGYKFVVKRSVASNTNIMRCRDMVYLEYTGYTQSSNGERLGFHIQHSVDVPGFPDLHDRNSTRLLQSVRYIFRQKSERVMEIYMLGNLELAGVLNVGGVGVGGSNGSGGDLFSISKLQQCAETRRLTLMVRRRREHIEVQQSSSVRRNTECYLCRRTKRFFSGAMLTECEVCGQFVCSKCRNDKKLFVCDVTTNGLLEKLQRAQTCKTCVLAASAGCAPPPMHISVAQQVAKNQGTEKASGVGSGSIAGHYSSSSSSRTSSIGERSDASGDSRVESELHSYRQGPVYTFSEVDEEKFKESRRQPPNQFQQQDTSSVLVHPSETNQSAANNSLDSQTLGHYGRPRQRPGHQQRESPPTTAISISKARGRSGTSSSNSSASSADSNSGRRGIYLTPPNPSKLYQEEQQRRHDPLHQHWLEHQMNSQELQRRQQHHSTANQLVVQNHYPVSSCGEGVVVYRGSHRQLANPTFDQDWTGRELANPYSKSYSGPSSAMSITAKTRFPKFPHSERGFQRTSSTPMASGNSRRSDLMTQMMELNMKAESTYHATQRNGVFLKHHIQTRQW